MSEPLLFTCTHGEDAPERATVPFIAASTAAVSGHRAIVVCSIDAVELGLPGRAEQIAVEGLPPLSDLLRTLTDAGGELWLCSACVTRRGITDDHELVPGATIVGAATIVEALAGGRAISLG